MDFYGICSGVKSVVDLYFRNARGTGRTTALVGSLKNGDRVICSSAGAARHIEREIIKRGILADVECFDIGNYHSLFMIGKSKGRTIFDHGWVEEFFRRQINDCVGYIGRLSDNLSYGDTQLNNFDVFQHNGSRQIPGSEG